MLSIDQGSQCVERKAHYDEGQEGRAVRYTTKGRPFDGPPVSSRHCMPLTGLQYLNTLIKTRLVQSRMRCRDCSGPGDCCGLEIRSGVTQVRVRIPPALPYDT